jgi:hypothetical protein
MNDRKKSVLERIKAAFPPVLLQDRSALVRDPQSHYEAKQFAEFLSLITAWSELTLRMLREKYRGDPSITIHLLTQHGVVALLPAYLTMCVVDYEEGDVVSQSVVGFLGKDTEAGLTSIDEVLPLLSDDQVLATKAVIDYLKEMHGFDFIGGELDRALETLDAR